MPNIDPLALLMIAVFILGYFFITLEHLTQINKTSIALLMGIICWGLQFIRQTESHEANVGYLTEHLSNISQIIFFLFCALTIVEIINAHKGFALISRKIHIVSKRKLMWVVGFITFFLSSILDNLTTTIIMVTLLRKLTDEGEDRLLLGGSIVVAANAGGAWTPIGDVTTTMLWIGGQVTTLAVIKVLFIPSIMCMIAAFLVLSIPLKGSFLRLEKLEEEKLEPLGKSVFWMGIASLVFVPVFKITTGLPPFMGIIFGLGLMWLLTDLAHKEFDDRHHLRVPSIMSRIDVSGVLFFLGILLAIDALHTAGILDDFADWMGQSIENPQIIAVLIGLVSAIIDNVPLVAATMGMYELTQFPPDSPFWTLMAYCAGTGGSVLIIGSAAGVAFLGMEKVRFFWYFRRVGIAALAGYFVGVLFFKLTVA